MIKNTTIFKINVESMSRNVQRIVQNTQTISIESNLYCLTYVTCVFSYDSDTL